MTNLSSAPFFNGMTFHYPPEQAPDYCVAGPDDVMGFEPEITRYLQSIFQEDTLFLDVGAALGYYTLLAANRVRHVVAFEPKTPERDVLRKNIECNELKNVTVMKAPLFSRAVRGSIRKCRFRPNPSGEYTTITLDSLGLVPDAIKIDVEGAELDVLMGAEETLYAHKPILAVEIHKHKIRTFDHHWTQVSGLLRDLGYTVTTLGERRFARFIKAEW